MPALPPAIGAMPRVRITRLDAGLVVKAQLPPPERRGIVLIDPAL